MFYWRRKGSIQVRIDSLICAVKFPFTENSAVTVPDAICNEFYSTPSNLCVIILCQKNILYLQIMKQIKSISSSSLLFVSQRNVNILYMLSKYFPFLSELQFKIIMKQNSMPTPPQSASRIVRKRLERSKERGEHLGKSNSTC